MVAEDSSAGGRADLVVRGDEGVHIFEFKLLPDASRTRARGEALAQIKARGYADKYRQPGRPVHLIGVEFSRAEYQAYLRYYNDERPHRGIDMMTPNAFHATLQDAAWKSEMC